MRGLAAVSVAKVTNESQNSKSRFAHKVRPVICWVRCSLWWVV